MVTHKWHAFMVADRTIAASRCGAHPMEMAVAEAVPANFAVSEALDHAKKNFRC